MQACRFIPSTLLPAFRINPQSPPSHALLAVRINILYPPMSSVRIKLHLNHLCRLSGSTPSPLTAKCKGQFRPKSARSRINPSKTLHQTQMSCSTISSKPVAAVLSLLPYTKVPSISFNPSHSQFKQAGSTPSFPLLTVRSNPPPPSSAGCQVQSPSHSSTVKLIFLHL